MKIVLSFVSRLSQSGAQWDEANVLRLISENKLAPKYSDTSRSNKCDLECPICFLVRILHLRMLCLYLHLLKIGDKF